MTSNLSDTITSLTNGGAERWRPRVPASTYLITALCELSGGCAQPSLSGARSPKYFVEIAAVVASERVCCRCMRHIQFYLIACLI